MENPADADPAEPNAVHLPPPAALVAAESEEMTPQQLAEAKGYGRQKLAVQLADKALDLVVLVVIVLLAARPLDAWLAAGIRSDSLRLLALAGIVLSIGAFTSLPLSFYSGYVLEHRYGLSRQSLGRWLWQQAKQLLLAAAFGGVLLVGLYQLIWWTGELWWLVSAVAFFMVSVVLGQLAPVLILPLFYKIEPLENPSLAERLARLAHGTGLTIGGIYRMVLSRETVKANAMLAGLGHTRRVLMGDTLLEQFSDDEIEVVFAHEVGHHVFRHIPKLMAAGFVFSLAGFWIANRALAVWVGPGYDPHHLPVASLPLLMLVLTVFSLVMEPLTNTLSRRFERQCDHYALVRTGLKQAYLSAFRKLARLNKDDPEPNRLEVLLFHSHPPIAERLAMAEQV